MCGACDLGGAEGELVDDVAGERPRPEKDIAPRVKDAGHVILQLVLRVLRRHFRHGKVATAGRGNEEPDGAPGPRRAVVAAPRVGRVA